MLGVHTSKWSRLPCWKHALPGTCSLKGPVPFPLSPYMVIVTLAFVEAPLTSLVLTVICTDGGALHRGRRAWRRPEARYKDLPRQSMRLFVKCLAALSAPKGCCLMVAAGWGAAGQSTSAPV